MNLRLSPRARASLLKIWLWNAERSGPTHADGYRDFLLGELRRIANDPGLGRRLDERLRVHTMRKGRRGHAHLAIYRVAGNEIEIVDVFHTAQDWKSKLEEL